MAAALDEATSYKRKECALYNLMGRTFISLAAANRRSAGNTRGSAGNTRGSAGNARESKGFDERTVYRGRGSNDWNTYTHTMSKCIHV